MDGGVSSSQPQSGQKIAAGERLYRTVMKNPRRKANQVSLSAFQLHPQDEYKLSMDWARINSPEQTLAILGASYNFTKTKYKDWESWEVFAVEVAFLLELERVMSVEHNPVYHRPLEKGKQDNPGHALVVLDKGDAEYWASKQPEVLFKIAEHAFQRPVPFDEEKTSFLVKDYRQKQDKIEKAAE